MDRHFAQRWGMLKRITLVNFMSHERTVIEPAAGLTVLVGPNNCGKSAVVTALRILCNNETADYAIRHGEKEAAVIVETDDGHTVEWRRKTSNRYVIDGQTFDRLNRKVPDELHKVLRLPTVDFDEKQFDVHFATQKEPLFLLNGSDGDRAQFFASSSDAVLLIEMQKQHASNIREANRKKKDREEESLQLNRLLKTLAPVGDLDARLRDIEQLYGELQQLARIEEDLAREISQLERADVARQRFSAVSRTLSPLASPPELAPADALEDEITALDQAIRRAAYDQARTKALSDLPLPPDQHDCQKLDELAAELAQAEKSIGQWTAKVSALDALAEPPPLSDTVSLERWLAQFDQAQKGTVAHQNRIQSLTRLAEPPKAVDASQLSALSTLTDQLARANDDHSRLASLLEEAQEKLDEIQAEIVAFAATHPKCPTCGAEIDADRLVSDAKRGVVRPHHLEHAHE